MFNPDWLALIDGFDVLRFMDWMHTNDATLAHWADRPEVGDATWREHGVPVEIMIRLAEELGAEPWFNIPHLADDDFVRNFAELVHTELDPELRAWVEFSNEVWNWQFDQAHWADEQGKALWRRNPSWIQFYAGRATEVVDIWSEVYGTEAEEWCRSPPTGWMGLEQEISTPEWAQRARRTAPGKHFDAYAITGYFARFAAAMDRAGADLDRRERRRGAQPMEADRRRAQPIEAHKRRGSDRTYDISPAPTAHRTHPRRRKLTKTPSPTTPECEWGSTSSPAKAAPTSWRAGKTTRTRTNDSDVLNHTPGWPRSRRCSMAGKPPAATSPPPDVEQPSKQKLGASALPRPEPAMGCGCGAR